ncbi:MAG: AAA family ATPase [Bacillota bacterium]|nr:AAA family ATPase [Bacillota bacterium]
MKISEAKQCIKELYLKTQSVAALISERGVGKTSAFKQCAEELGIGYMGLYAAALEGPDFMGLPDKDSAKGITRYLAPQFLPTVQAVNEGIFPAKGILVLEEINRVPSDTVSVLYPLLLERKINGHSLAEGWKIGVTMNPDNLNYSVNSLDDAMLDRFVSIEIIADLEDYIEFSLHNGPNDDTLAFLQACPDMLLVVKKSADSGALSKSPTPRGWTKVQELLNNCDLNDKLMVELIAGILGPEVASAFLGYIRSRDFAIPSTQKLLNSFEEVRPSIQGIMDKNRLDIINLIIKKIVVGYEVEKNQIDNMNCFVEFLNEELRVLFFKVLASKRPEDFEETVKSMPVFDSVADKVVEIIIGKG